MRDSFGFALCAAALLCAAPAVAQQRQPHPNIVAAVDTVMEKFTPLLVNLGLGATDFLPREQLIVALDAAMPMLPDDEDVDWNATWEFDFRNELTPNTLEPDPQERTVYADARSCEETRDGLEIVHFRRFARDGVQGHQCVLLFAGSVPEVWLLVSRGFAEGEGRRMATWSAMALSITGDTARSRQMLVDRIEPNVALSSALNDYAFTLLLLSPRRSEPMSIEDATARLERMRRALEDVANDAEEAGQ